MNAKKAINNKMKASEIIIKKLYLLVLDATILLS